MRQRTEHHPKTKVHHRGGIQYLLRDGMLVVPTYRSFEMNGRFDPLKKLRFFILSEDEKARLLAEFKRHNLDGERLLISSELDVLGEIPLPQGDFLSAQEAKEYWKENEKLYRFYLRYGSDFHGESRDEDFVELSGRGARYRALAARFPRPSSVDRDLDILNGTIYVRKEFRLIAIACVATEYPEFSDLMPPRDVLAAACKENAAWYAGIAKKFPFDFFVRKAIFAHYQWVKMENEGAFADTKSAVRDLATEAQKKCLYHEASDEEVRVAFEELFGESPQEFIIEDGYILNEAGDSMEVVMDSCGPLSESDADLLPFYMEKWGGNRELPVNISRVNDGYRWV